MDEELEALYDKLYELVKSIDRFCEDAIMFDTKYADELNDERINNFKADIMSTKRRIHMASLSLTLFMLTKELETIESHKEETENDN